MSSLIVEWCEFAGVSSLIVEWFELAVVEWCELAVCRVECAHWL